MRNRILRDSRRLTVVPQGSTERELVLAELEEKLADVGSTRGAAQAINTGQNHRHQKTATSALGDLLIIVGSKAVQKGLKQSGDQQTRREGVLRTNTGAAVSSIGGLLVSWSKMNE